MEVSSVELTNKDSVCIQGAILDNANRDPVFGVSILVKGSRLCTITDNDGEFSFTVPRHSELLIAGFGFKNKRVEVDKITDPANFVIVMDDDLSVVSYYEQAHSPKKFLLDGKYANKENSLKIWVKGDTLTLYRTAQIGDADELLAVCKISYESNNFMKLSSVLHPMQRLLTDYNINFSADNSVENDKVRVYFRFPSYKKPLDIILSTNQYNSYRFTYSERSTSFDLPLKGFESILIQIPNPVESWMVNSDGSFLGMLYYNISISADQIGGNNVVNVDMPMVSREFFNEFYFKEDYVKFVGSKIFWRGEEFSHQ